MSDAADIIVDGIKAGQIERMVAAGKAFLKQHPTSDVRIIHETSEGKVLWVKGQGWDAAGWKGTSLIAEMADGEEGNAAEPTIAKAIELLAAEPGTTHKAVRSEHKGKPVFGFVALG